MSVLEITSKAGVVYAKGDGPGSSWWRRRKWDGPDYLVGAEHNLPKEILRKLYPTKNDQEIAEKIGVIWA